MAKKSVGPKPTATKNDIEAVIASMSPEEKAKLANTLQNGLGDALGYQAGGIGFPYNQGSPHTEQLSNVNTIFKNLRWYLVSNFRQVLSEAYVELGLIQTIVDVPVDDALRGGIEIKSKQLDEDQIEELKVFMDREDDLNTVGQAAKWNRLFGGAGILIMTDQDPTKELNLDAIKKDSPLEFKAVDMWELFWDRQEAEDYDPTIQEGGFEMYSYYSFDVHKSRVMPIKGLNAPSFIRPRLRGWGFSVVEILVRSINQYLKATDLSFEVLDEFKLDVYKIKNLVNTLMSPNGQQKVQQRVQLANWQKNYQNAVVMDSEDDFDHKQLSFSGLAEAMAGIRMQVASDMRMPLTKLFGISAAGFNSGEDDIEVYNAMVEAQVRNKIKYEIIRICEIRCKQLFDFIPDDLAISFKPLRMMSAKEEEDVKTQKFQRILQAKQANELTTHEFREAMNKQDLLGISLDVSGDSLNPDDPEVAALVSGEPETTEEDAKGGDEERDPNEVDSETTYPIKNALVDFKGPRIVTVGLLSGTQILTGKRNDNGLWTSPGGHMDDGESIEEAACREVLEETGIKILPDDLKLISSELLTSHRTGKDFVVFAFLASVDKEKAVTHLDPDNEISEWKWVNIDPKTPELQNENRHAKADAILSHLFKIKNGFDNSLEYEMAAYEADGGDGQMLDGRKPFFEKAKAKDKALYQRAFEVSREAYGKDNWKFAVWFYKKQGGTFGV